jgi:hypothetical protein
MGLRGAPSYFQIVVATEMLNGLIVVIIKKLINDVIVYSQTEEKIKKLID